MPTKEELAQLAFNEVAKSLMSEAQDKLRTPEDGTIMGALHAHTHALVGIGYLLEAILDELRSR